MHRVGYIADTPEAPGTNMESHYQQYNMAIRLHYDAPLQYMGPISFHLRLTPVIARAEIDELTIQHIRKTFTGKLHRMLNASGVIDLYCNNQRMGEVATWSYTNIVGTRHIHIKHKESYGATITLSHNQ